MIPKIQKILYTTDLSPNSDFAFRYAIIFAKQHDADIIFLHVLEELSESVLPTLASDPVGDQRKKSRRKR